MEKHDSPQMQERNWQWMASRIADLGYLQPSEEEGFLGEVLSVEPQPAGGNTLAFVTLRRLVLPEQLSIGRRPHHGVNDIYDLDGDAMGPFRLPVEELVIVQRKFERARQEPIKCKSSDIPFIQYKYLQSDNVLKPLFPEVGKEDHSINNICHRCQINQLSNGKQLCDDCTKVIRPYRKIYATTLADVCDCKDCRRKIAVRMDQMLKTNVRRAQDILNGEEIKNAEGDREASAICCVCCLSCTTGVQCDMCPVVMHQNCFMWGGLVDGKDPEETLCRSCSFEVHVDDINCEAAFAKATSLAKAMCPIDFDLPANFLDPTVLPVPSSKAITSAKTKTTVRSLTPNGKRRGRPPKSAISVNGEVKTPSTTTPLGKKRGRPPKLSKSDKVTPDSHPSGPSKDLEISDDDDEFRPTCSRTHQYDPIMRRFSGIPKHQSSSLVYWKPDTRLNHRKEGENEDEIK